MAQSTDAVTITRTITYTYDPLNRLTAAYYSTGESFEYAYTSTGLSAGDEVGNRTAMTDTLGSHTYPYDAANRLTSVGGVPCTWDARGNLVSDGTFTYAYNGAGRMMRAENVRTARCAIRIDGSPARPWASPRKSIGWNASFT